MSKLNPPQKARIQVIKSLAELITVNDSDDTIVRSSISQILATAWELARDYDRALIIETATRIQPMTGGPG